MGNNSKLIFRKRNDLNVYPCNDLIKLGRDTLADAQHRKHCRRGIVTVNGNAVFFRKVYDALCDLAVTRCNNNGGVVLLGIVFERDCRAVRDRLSIS